MYTRKDMNNFAWSQGRLQKEVISGRVGKSRSLLGEEEKALSPQRQNNWKHQVKEWGITKRVLRHFLLCEEI